MTTSTTPSKPSKTPKQPGKSKAAWETAVSPDAISKNFRINAIAMTVIITTLAIVIAILVVAVVILAGDARQSKSTDTGASSRTDNSASQNDTAEGTTVDISGLDGTKLITAADLEQGEIPDHYLGDKKSPVVVIEYEDFACSHCQALAAYAEQIHADYKSKVLFIHRSFSLTYPNSDGTLRAAEAAYQLGGEKAYWAMTKLLYQDTRWTSDELFGASAVLKNYAEEIGLNADKFQEVMANAAATNKITRDKELGSAAGVNGTPTWFINGQRVTASDADIRAALDAAL
jgi:protein-disulfide isomerase